MPENAPVGDAPVDAINKAKDRTGWAPFKVTAKKDDAQSRIEELEQWIKNHPLEFDWNVHNELRHLYSTKTPPNLRKAMEHVNVILQHSVMDEYILNILSGWQIGKDTSAARKNLEQLTKDYPDLRFLVAACFVKIGDLYNEEGKTNKDEGKLNKAKTYYILADGYKSSEMEKYYKIADDRLKAISTPPRIEKFDNRNWAGYIITGEEGSPINFKKIEASWTVPSLNCHFIGQALEHSSYWVGLGGPGTDLMQIGTISNCFPFVGSLNQTHKGILEYLPAGRNNEPEYLDADKYRIDPNDQMEASVEHLGKGKYQLTLHNKTKEWAWSETKEGSMKEAALQIVECIVEMPPSDIPLLTRKNDPGYLADFKELTFKGCNVDGRSLLRYPRLYQVTMKNGTNLMAEHWKSIRIAILL